MWRHVTYFTIVTRLSKSISAKRKADPKLFLRCFFPHLKQFARFSTFCSLKHAKNTCGEVIVLSFSLQLHEITLLHGSFSRFLNCTNGTKSRRAAHLLDQSQQRWSQWLRSGVLCWFWTEFTHSSGVSIVDFKQVHAVWELFKTHFKAFVKCLEDKHHFLRSEWFFIRKPLFQASRENFAQKLISQGKRTDLRMILVIKFYFLLRPDGHRLQW